MINKINFTGRETMLTKGVKEVADKANEYVGTGKIYTNRKINTVLPQEYISASKIFEPDDNRRIVAMLNAIKEETKAETISKAEDLYTSPFAPIEHSVTKDSKVKDETNSYFYNVAHGKPREVAEENVSEPRTLLNIIA